VTSRKKIFYITLTNEGYIDYTENLLNSIIQNKCNIDLNIYTLDDKSFNHFKDKVNTIPLGTVDNNITKFTHQTDDNFGHLMLSKFEAIHEALTSQEIVVYLDGDIVVKKSFEEFILQNLKDRDILFQNDKRPSKPNEIKLCAGFMCINSNKKMINFFEPTEKVAKKFLKYGTHDQAYINRNKSKFKYGVLPLESFPNGPYYYANVGNFEPHLIHFNFLIGDVKKDKMKEYGEWYS